MNNRKGLAVAVVLFFAFAVGIMMSAVLKSSSNTNFVTKRAINELQADYLAQSSMLLAKYYIKLFPTELYYFYLAHYYGNFKDKSKYKKDFSEREKKEHALRLTMGGVCSCSNEAINPPVYKADYDLFKDCSFQNYRYDPYVYSFEIDEIEYKASQGTRGGDLNSGNLNRSMSMVQDNYRILASASVIVNKKTTINKKIDETFMISRF